MKWDREKYATSHTGIAPSHLRATHNSNFSIYKKSHRIINACIYFIILNIIYKFNTKIKAQKSENALKIFSHPSYVNKSENIIFVRNI